MLPSMAFQLPSTKTQSSRPREITVGAHHNTVASPKRTPTANLQHMLSPVSDSFPTPRASDFPSIPSQANNLPSISKPTLKVMTTYDDLYDISEDEEEQRDTVPEIKVNTGSSRSSLYSPRSPATRHSWGSNSSAASSIRKHPSLRIPSPATRHAPHNFSKHSPVPPTPPPKIPISPAILSLLMHDAPSSTAPPSLDGSLTSEQLASSEAPPTPSTGPLAEDSRTWGAVPETLNARSTSNNQPWESGIQLNPEALATLQIFSDIPAETTVIETPIEEPVSRPQEMQQTTRLLAPITEQAVPAALPSLNTHMDLSEFDIPSPTGFFSSLAPTSRDTWTFETEAIPTSATAEHFYIPSIASRTDGPVERVIEHPRESISAGPLTAFKTEQERSMSPEAVQEVNEIKTQEDYDQHYEQNLQAGAALHFDRTSMWLQQQQNFVVSLKDAAAAGEPSSTSASPAIGSSVSPVLGSAKTPPIGPLPAIKQPSARSSMASPPRRLKRASAVPTIREEGAPLHDKKDAVFHHAFQHAAEQSKRSDAYTYSVQRLDALQTRRLCLQSIHKKRLDGVYEPLVKTISEDASDEAKAVIRVEKEQNALYQIDEATWNIAATKMLNGGRLLSKPAAKRLARFSRLGEEGNRGRVLDLGGQPVCDWAWECARENPNVKVYSVVTKALRHPSITNIRGPSNHRVVSVPAIWKLPFADSHFDVISARTLHTFLKADIPHGEYDDEFTLVLQECMRCLKPGGYLDFSLMDADMMRAGPLASSLATEFAYNLKSRGYDPNTTRVWLGRLRKAGFWNIKRAWMFLPAGPGPAGNAKGAVAGSEGDAAVASADNIAAVTGLVGGLAWEKWMMKLQAESGKVEEGLFERVRIALDEGAKVGAGWRCLSGYARKPLP